MRVLELARRSRGTPRVANRILRRARDYAQVKADGRISYDVANMALNKLGVDKFGLDIMDRNILKILIDNRFQIFSTYVEGASLNFDLMYLLILPSSVVTISCAEIPG